MKNLLRFDFRHFRGDLFGGLTAGIVALPLALAFGVSSGLGPSAGLYGAIFVSFFAALFGGTPTQISGPTAPMTAVSMVFIADMLAKFDGQISQALPTILAVFLTAAVLQILLGYIGVGKYIRYIPYPVVSGFMTAIGVIILITQIAPVMGYYAKEDHNYVNRFTPLAEEVLLEKILREEVDEGILVLEDFETTIQRAEKISFEAIATEAETLAGKASSGVLGTIKILPQIFRNINFLELILALATIFIIYGFKRITTSIPSTLVALFLVTGGALALGLDYRPITAIPSGLPLPQWDLFNHLNIELFSNYFFVALTLSLLGAIDSLLTSIVADNMTKTVHQPNKELVGQGIGNFMGALFGGIPGAGATIRTVVNINAGGKTKLSGMIAGLLLLFILMGIGPIASQIPAAVLAGILVTVGIGVMDFKGLRAIPHMPKSEVIILIVVLVLSSIWNLVYAVGIGLVIAALMFMKKIGDLTSQSARVVSLQKEGIWPDEQTLPNSLKKQVFIKHLEGPLFFGATAQFSATLKQLPDEAGVLIVRLDKVPYLDQSGLYALEEVVIDLVKNGKKVLFIGVQEQPRYLLQRIDLIPNLVAEEQIFSDFKTSISWMIANIEHE